MPTTAELLNTIDWRGSSKVFIMLFILGVIFFIFYILIKPDHSPTINILAFPSTGPFVPLDSSTCGVNVVNCTGKEELCASSGCPVGEYGCTFVSPGKEVWYLGTKLDSGKSFCLPQQKSNNNSTYNECGTYTGKAVWNQTEWACQCKYPSLFSGSDCMEQQACKRGENPPGKLIRAIPGKDGTPVIWDPSKVMSAEAANDNPLDLNGTGPLYQCDCASAGPSSYTDVGDPYRCGDNLCYAGSNTISSGIPFDPILKECGCDNITTVKSNVTGFCYPVESALAETGCNPDILTGNCTCGNFFIVPSDSASKPLPAGSYGPGNAVFFRYGPEVWFTYQIVNDPLCKGLKCPIYKQYMNGFPTLDTDGEKIVDKLFQTLPDIKGGMVEFSLMQYQEKNISDTGGSAITEYILRSYPAFRDKTNAAAATIRGMSSVSQPSFAIPCDSFFYNRPNGPGCPDAGCPKCSDPFYASSDLNNKNGTMCYAPMENQLCGGYGNPHVDPFDPEGYNCTCKDENTCIYTDDTVRDGHIFHSCSKCQQCAGEVCKVGNNGCDPCHHCNSAAPGCDQCGAKFNLFGAVC